MRGFWLFLRANGIDARLDLPAADRRQDWAQWMTRQVIEADRILVVASPGYRQGADGDCGPHDGRGVQWEARLIRERFYGAQDEGLQVVLPVVLPDCSPADLPLWLAPMSTTHYQVTAYAVEGAEKLLRVLTGQPRQIEPELGPVPQLPSHPCIQVVGERDAAREHSGPDLPGRLISEWSPVALGVHPSIGGALPVYVSRGHDILLRAVMNPECGTNRLIVMRGGSSTGKSRAAFEAVHAWLPTWRVDYPGSAKMLAKRLEAGLRSRTVLWLGDLRGYVQARAGQNALSALVDLFGRHGYLIVITAVWPEFWGLYTKDPDPETPGPSAWLPDGFRHFLKALPVWADDQITDLDLGAGGVLDVPDRFTAAELQRAHDLVRQTGDPVLGEVLGVAADAGTPGEIAQHAAGAPHLREHYDGPGADSYGRALITAAMDLSRLGLPGPFPRRLLISAAEGYLSDRQRATAQDWQAGAIDYASSQLRGNLYALEPAPPERGFGVAGYRLADYLDQYGRQRRRDLLIPRELWDGLISATGNAEERILLAQEAEYRCLYQVAAEFAVGQAESGLPDAMQLIARQWNRMGLPGQAIAWYRRSLEAAPGDHGTAGWLADLLEQVGEAEEAARLQATYQRGLLPLSIILGGEDEIAGKKGEIRRLAAAGDARAMLRLADLLRGEGQDDEAVRWYREAAKSGELKGIWKGASLLEEQGQIDQAVDLLRPYAEAENREAIWRLYQMLERHEREDEALVWIQRDVSLGNPIALARLGGWLHRQGAHVEAERLYRVWAEEKKDPAAMWYLAEHLVETDRTEEAIAWFQRSAEDSLLGLNILVDRLEELRCAQAAEAPLKAWAAKGNRSAMQDLARLYEKLGRNDEAEHIHRSMLELGDSDEFPRMPGQTTSNLIVELADFLERTGRAAESSQLRKFGIKPGGATAQLWKPIEP